MYLLSEARKDSHNGLTNHLIYDITFSQECTLYHIVGLLRKCLKTVAYINQLQVSKIVTAVLKRSNTLVPTSQKRV